jgi:DNA-binding response OmpR family regulator
VKRARQSPGHSVLVACLDPGKMISFFAKKQISSLTVKLPREELLRRSRILIVDDEPLDLLQDLKAARFAVDQVQDIDNTNLDIIDRPLYDLILLDFGKVGKHFGGDEGLSLLKHIKRVNPAIVVFAYTSKALRTEHADFYRMADGVLAKDAGITASMEKIEEGLRKAHSLPNVWSSLLTVCDINPGSKEDLELQDLFVRGLNSQSKMQRLKAQVINTLSSDEGQKIGLTLLAKAIELGVKSHLGG